MVTFYNSLDKSALNAVIVWIFLNREDHMLATRSLLVSFVAKAKKLAGLQDEGTNHVQVYSSDQA